MEGTSLTYKIGKFGIIVNGGHRRYDRSWAGSVTVILFSSSSQTLQGNRCVCVCVCGQRKATKKGNENQVARKNKKIRSVKCGIWIVTIKQEGNDKPKNCNS